MKNNNPIHYTLMLSLFAFTSCGESVEVTHYQEEKERAVEAPAVVETPLHTEPEPAESHGESGPYHWIAPASWKSLPASGMRLATFTVPLESESGDCSVVRLGGSAGGMLANVNRWRRQVGLQPYDEAALNKDRQERKGGWNYSYFKIVNPDQPDNAMLGAIFESSDATLFVKLKASAKGVGAAEADYLKFCDSIHAQH